MQRVSIQGQPATVIQKSEDGGARRMYRFEGESFSHPDLILDNTITPWTCLSDNPDRWPACEYLRGLLGAVLKVVVVQATMPEDRCNSTRTHFIQVGR